VIEQAEIPERWKSNFELAKLMLDEAGVELIEVVS
jgi:hypothetical protein